jgi:hypothetical protein
MLLLPGLEAPVGPAPNVPGLLLSEHREHQEVGATSQRGMTFSPSWSGPSVLDLDAEALRASV